MTIRLSLLLAAVLLVCGCYSPGPLGNPSPEGASTQPPERISMLHDACAGSSYTECEVDLDIMADLAAGSLVAICEYADGEGDIVIVRNEQGAARACSGDGLIDPSKVHLVLQLP